MEHQVCVRDLDIYIERAVQLVKQKFERFVIAPPYIHLFTDDPSQLPLLVNKLTQMELSAQLVADATKQIWTHDQEAETATLVLTANYDDVENVDKALAALRDVSDYGDVHPATRRAVCDIPGAVYTHRRRRVQWPLSIV